ncbi:MAG: hypothetical protein WC935_08270 [Thermoleophilia bacterium]
MTISRQEYLEKYLSGFPAEPADGGRGGGNKPLLGKVPLPERYLAGGREQFELSGYLPAGVLTGPELLEILKVAGCLEEPGETSSVLRYRMSDRTIRLKEGERRLAELDALYSSRFFMVYRIFSLPGRAVRVARSVIGRVMKHPAYRRHLAGRVRSWLGRSAGKTTTPTRPEGQAPSTGRSGGEKTD